MATPTPILNEALRAVEEPELERDIVELGLVRAAELVDGTARITVALPAEGYPADSAEELDRRIGAALRAAGVAHAEIDHDVLSDDEQAALKAQLIGDPEATAGTVAAHGHAEGRAVPFAEPGSRTRTLLIASGKGGVGKSTVTVNLAVALARAGHRVGVLDADVWGFSIPRMLGVDRPPLAVERMIVPPKANGVRCISMGFFAHEDQAVIWRGPMLHKALEQFLTDVWWGEPDYLLVDLPPGTGDISISLSQFLPKSEVVLVTTPQPAAQRVAQRAGAMAEKVNLTISAVIENMSWFETPSGERFELFGAGGGQLLADKLGVPLAGQVPLTMELRQGGDDGRPVAAHQPTSPAGAAFVDLAGWIVEHAPKRVYRSELRIV